MQKTSPKLLTTDEAVSYYYCMTTLYSIYKTEGPKVFKRLSEATGANHKYLYQIAKGIKRPSPEMAKKLIAAEPSLTLEELLFPSDQ